MLVLLIPYVEGTRAYSLAKPGVSLTNEFRIIQTFHSYLLGYCLLDVMGTEFLRL